MFTVAYKYDLTEFAKANFCFLSNRPFLKVLFAMMRFCCLALLLVFGLKVYYRAASASDYGVAIFVILWFLYFKKLHYKAIKLGIKGSKLDKKHEKYEITRDYIKWNLQGNNFSNTNPKKYNEKKLLWKKISFVYNQENGFIIPLPGMLQSGKFLWLPIRGFVNKQEIEEFRSLLHDFKIKVKKI